MNNNSVGLIFIEAIEEVQELIAEGEYKKAEQVLLNASRHWNDSMDFEQEYIQIWKKLCLCARKNNEFSKGLEYANSLERFVKKRLFSTSKLYWKRELAICQMTIGTFYDVQEKSEIAERYYWDGCECFKQLGDYKSMIKGYISIGIIYDKNKKYKKAIELFEKCLLLIEGKNVDDQCKEAVNNYLLELRRKIV